MKLKIIPDYSKEIDKIFLVSPLNLRNDCSEEFLKFLQTIVEIIVEKNKGQKVIICCGNGVINLTKNLIFEIPYFNDLKFKEDIIEFVNVEVLDIWIRDYFSCANIDLGDEIAVLKAVYSPNYNSFAEIDDAAGQYLAQSYFNNVLNIPLKLDGGNVISNSEYIFCSEKLYTENFNIGKGEIDNFFEETFEQKLITLPTEVLDVIGHSDSILRFLDDKTIILPIYDQEFKIDNRYVMNIKRRLSEILGMDYKFVFFPSYIDDGINNDNIFSAKGLYLNFFRFEDHIIFPKFENLIYYENRIMENIKKYAPNIKIHWSSCDNISFHGGCWNCVSNVKYKL